MQQFAYRCSGVRRAQYPVKTGNTDQSESDDQQPRDCTATESDIQRRVQAQGRGLRGAHVRAYRHVHSHVTRRA